MSAFEVGQEVIIRPGYGSERAGTVARVGRKNVYVKVYGRETSYDKDTGWERTNARSIGMPSRIGTAEMFAEIDYQTSVADRLREEATRYGWIYRLSTRGIERTLTLLDEEST